MQIYFTSSRSQWVTKSILYSSITQHQFKNWNRVWKCFWFSSCFWYQTEESQISWKESHIWNNLRFYVFFCLKKSQLLVLIFTFECMNAIKCRRHEMMHCHTAMANDSIFEMSQNVIYFGHAGQSQQILFQTIGTIRIYGKNMQK